MSPSTDVAQRYFDAWNRHDGPAIVATFAEGGSYRDPSTPVLTGEAIARYAEALWGAFPDLSFEILGAPLAADGRVAARWLMKGTNRGAFLGLPPSGRAISLPGADFIEVEGGRIRSVTGYFDGGEVPRQLGLQVVTQPDTIGPFRFGVAAAVRGREAHRTPGAFSITALQASSPEHAARVREMSRETVREWLEEPGFIGWTGMTLADRQLTVTAWDGPETPRRLMSTGTHREAMRAFFDTDLAVAGHTSVWAPVRLGTRWVRCPHCGRMSDGGGDGGTCPCGRPLPAPPPYW